MSKRPDEHSPKEAAQIRDKALFRALHTPPKPREDSRGTERPAPKGGPKSARPQRGAAPRKPS